MAWAGVEELSSERCLYWRPVYGEWLRPAVSNQLGLWVWRGFYVPGGGVLTTPDDECMPVLWKDLDRDLPCVGFVLSLRKVTPLGWALSWSHLLLALYFRAPGCSFPVCHGRDGDGSRGRVGKEGLVDGRSERGWASAVYSWEWW